MQKGTLQKQQVAMPYRISNFVLIFNILLLSTCQKYGSHSSKSNLNLSNVGSCDCQSTNTEFNRFVAFCSNYKTSTNGVPILPVLDDKIAHNLGCWSVCEKPKFLKAILTVLLRNYSAQLKCCNQSYDLCNEGGIDSLKNPLPYYFGKITGLTISCNEAPSSIPYDWVLTFGSDNIKHDLTNEIIDIQKELNRIKDL